MKKKYIVKNQRDFTKIIKNSHFKKNSSLIIYYIDNNLEYDRYGISVGKKLGNAVFRNKYKRKLRAIIDNNKKDYVNYKDYIIILRESGSKKEYKKLEEDFLLLIESINKGEKYEKKKTKEV